MIWLVLKSTSLFYYSNREVYNKYKKGQNIIVIKEKICGIYKIKNIKNNKIYIGSSIDIQRRWKEHISDLQHNKHPNTHLQNSWNKYGKENFIFEILEKCDSDCLLEKEQYYIDKYKVAESNNGYNIAPRADKPFLSEYGKKRVKEVNSEKFKGENCLFHKYKESEIIYVIKMLKDGCYTLEDISNKTNIPIGTIKSIYYKDSWKYLTQNIDFPKLIVSNDSKELRQDEILEIIELIKNGKTNSEIASIYNTDSSTINNIRTKKYHNDLTQDIELPILHRSNLTETEIQTVIAKLLNGEQNNVIAEDLNINSGTVASIRNHRSYTDYTKGIIFPKGKNKNALLFLERKKIIIECMKNNPDVSQAEIARLTGINTASVNRIVKSLDEII